MKLITDHIEGLNYITEANESGTKQHFIEGVFLQSERLNKNGRKYPKNTLSKEVKRFMNELVEQNRAYGELGHPQGPQINLDRVCMMIKGLKEDGDNYIGKAKITDTPMGNIVKGLLGSGANLGVSSRGMGSLVPGNDGAMVVQPDFHLTAIDCVADPSAPDAFVKGVMENVDWIYDASTESWHQERLDTIKKSLRKMSMDDIERNRFSIFEGFIRTLTSK